MVHHIHLQRIIPKLVTFEVSKNGHGFCSKILLSSKIKSFLISVSSKDLSQLCYYQGDPRCSTGFQIVITIASVFSYYVPKNILKLSKFDNMESRIEISCKGVLQSTPGKAPRYSLDVDSIMCLQSVPLN